MTSDKLTMTIPEVANVLGISRGLAYELAKRDELPVKVLRIGERRMVISRIALDRLLEKSSQQVE
ncbi:helix-turn-helix transcriptional regulator [Chloroflexota bacterium]